MGNFVFKTFVSNSQVKSASLFQSFLKPHRWEWSIAAKLSGRGDVKQPSPRPNCYPETGSGITSQFDIRDIEKS